MKNIRKIVILLLGAVWVLAGCSKRQEFDLRAPGEGSVTFLFGFQEAEADSALSTRAGGPERLPEERIGQMWYLITDSRGERLDLRTHRLEADFSKLTVEGLKEGDYTIVFMAAADAEQARTTVELPDRLTDVWLRNPTDAEPLDAVYYYKKLDFHIGREQASVSQTVALERCVGRVDVDLNLTSEYMWRFIRKVEIEFDQTDGVYTAFDATGVYSGVGAVPVYDITETCSFYSLPSRNALSGVVTVESERSDGTHFVRRYRFSECRIEAGRISHISIRYLHPESQEGLLYVREQDLARFDLDTMFLADEPREVFYNSGRRSFYANAPLQLSVNQDHRMLVKFYSPVAIRDVKIMCRFNKFSPEFVELARFDLIYPFMEAAFELPVVSSERLFATASGRKIRVPAQPELTNDDVTFLIQTEDPFMKKIERIDSRWYIRFSPYSADAGHAYWRHMNPLLCRHGVALALNMAFMFSSEEFNAEMNNYEGRLLDNGRNPINLDALRQRIRGHGGLVLGCVAGVGGLGGGSTYGLANYCYTGVYFDATPPNSHPHSYPRQAMFHEYGHCLGYNHSSTMTYGNQWTVLCATVFVQMGKDGKLPVCSKDAVGNLPM
ncbi:hypothetical protein [uncultured Rikenella sp.]|uniref:hypothetical protein n=1 Tax=uncultured Rikenella sp. TaxID=368003 RepID=UPI0025DBB894|nr:hypothetical protein [uncultured Rikenella sp.]